MPEPQLFETLSALDKLGRLESFVLKRTKVKRTPNKWYCALKTPGHSVEMTGETPEFVVDTVLSMIVQMEKLNGSTDAPL